MEDGLKLLGDLIGEYGRSVGMSNLSLDEGEQCSLLFDDELHVTLQLDQDTNMLVIFAEVGALPESKVAECCQKLLEANYFWQHTGGLGTLAVLPSNDPNVASTVTLLFQTPVISLDFGTFQNHLEIFVDTAEAWMDYLAEVEQGMESRDREEPDADFRGPVIRV